MSASLPLIVLFGPTASGKTSLSLALAERFHAEIVSCDSVCVYRGMQLGTAKPTPAERARIPHHCLDLYDPTEACTAGDYARHARAALAGLAARETLPLLAGGTGLYFRALLDGLFPSPPPDPALRERLRARASRRGPASLHRLLQRLDKRAAAAIHPNDGSKVIRALEVSLAERKPMTEQWTSGRDALAGYRVLRLGLDPPRALLYDRINARAAAMFAAGLLEEARGLRVQYGAGCRPFSSLGYRQAGAVLDGSMTEAEAIADARQGHRNYAKRQMTWFRREAETHATHWLRGPGDAPEIVAEAVDVVERFWRKTSNSQHR